MLIDYKGPTISVIIDANELTNNYVNITLEDGYSFEKIKILTMSNVSELVPYCSLRKGDSVTYPPIRSTSPCTLTLLITDITKGAICSITIEKFGQEPNIDYFKGKITPILVTGDDGKKYNVIPSDQFK